MQAGPEATTASQYRIRMHDLREGHEPCPNMPSESHDLWLRQHRFECSHCHHYYLQQRLRGWCARCDGPPFLSTP